MRVLFSASLLLALGLPLAFACGTTASSTDAGTDASANASADANADANADAGCGAVPTALCQDGCGGFEASTCVNGQWICRSDPHACPPPDAGADCGGKTCAPGDVCMRTYTTGGRCLMCQPDGGGCPTGTTCSGPGGCCKPTTISYTYACEPAPSGCSGDLTCGGCGTLCSGGCPCESVTADAVTCHCLAP